MWPAVCALLAEGVEAPSHRERAGRRRAGPRRGTSARIESDESSRRRWLAQRAAASLERGLSGTATYVHGRDASATLTQTKASAGRVPYSTALFCAVTLVYSTVLYCSVL